MGGEGVEDVVCEVVFIKHVAWLFREFPALQKFNQIPKPPDFQLSMKTLRIVQPSKL